MWRRQRQPRDDQAPQLSPAMQTATLLKELRQEGNINTLEHWAQLYSITGRIGIDGTVALKLMEAGFSWFVPSSFAERFPYSAAVRGGGRADPVVFWSFPSQGEILYIGDLPTFALARAKVALDCGIKYLTIHSCQPLPVNFARCEPVMLGWVDNPHLSQFPHQLFNPQMAVVVAAWDLDKEIVIL